MPIRTEPYGALSRPSFRGAVLATDLRREKTGVVRRQRAQFAHVLSYSIDAVVIERASGESQNNESYDSDDCHQWTAAYDGFEKP